MREPTVTLWVPAVWREDLKEPSWGADLPDVEWAAEIPSELDRTLPRRTEPGDVNPQKHRGDPAVRYCRVRINAADLPKVRQYLQQKYGKPDLSADVPEEDRLLIDVCAVIRKPRGVVDEDAVEALFEAKRGEVVNAPLARRRAIKRVLIHAVHRGLPADRAERIRQRLNLPLAAQGAVTRGR